ncbi:MAG: peptidase domain protein [Bradyrhizobium sp.]|nr:peptidase domain protein [Bradyrhizobium sp.]
MGIAVVRGRLALHIRRLAGGSALVVLAAAGVAQTRPAPVPATVTRASEVKPSQPWPQEKSDLAPDPAVRFGTLPNGVRYAILHNATPPGQASLMLRIDAGSLMEKDNQLGLAHFMEHMAFNGTTHIPKNDMIAILERLGLAFGADLNAATSFDETFYQLQMPRNDDKTLDTGLHVLREQVSEATMDADDIVGERGVIAGEERLRNTPGLRISRTHLNLLARGQKVAARFPIGDLNIINSATRDRFVDFYNSYYRPSRATLVAVGDFDVSAMEAKIRDGFGDWQPKAPDGAEPDLGPVLAHGAETHVTVETGISSTIALTRTRAPDLTPDTRSKRQSDLIEKLGFAVLNRRLGELSRTDDAPFLTASADHSTVVRSVDVVAVTAQFLPGKWKRALQAIDQEQRRIVTYGISDAELRREITALRSSYENAAKASSTRNTRALAAILVNAVNERQVFTSPEADLALFEATAKGLTPAHVDAVLKSALNEGSPLTLVTSPVPIEGGETAVAAALRDSLQVAVKAPVVVGKTPWPYTDFGKPGMVASRRELPGLGATVVTFANGVTLTVKSTTFSKDSVSINLLTGLGEQNFSPDSFDPRLTLIGGLQSGGLGKMTVDQMSRSLNGHIVGAGLATLGDRFMLSGGTRREDFQLEMQVLAAYLTDPAFRSTIFEQTKANYPAGYAASLALPAGAFKAFSSSILAGGDQRAAVVPPETLATISMDSWRPQLKALLAKGPIHITMVGDVSVDEAIAVTATTFGALPPRPAPDAPAPGADQRHFPPPTVEPVHFFHNGLAEQGLGYITWPTTDVTHDFTEARRIEVLAAVLKLRVLDEIREHLALAYSPGVTSSYSDTYKGYGRIAVSAETAPDKLPAFFKAMDGIIEGLQNTPISDDELKRAREPMIEDARRSRNSNYWWLSELTYAVDRPWYLPQTLTSIDDLAAVTPADVQAMARKYLRPEVAWKAEVLPAKPGTSAGNDSSVGR